MVAGLLFQFVWIGGDGGQFVAKDPVIVNFLATALVLMIVYRPRAKDLPIGGLHICDHLPNGLDELARGTF